MSARSSSTMASDQYAHLHVYISKYEVHGLGEIYGTRVYTYLVLLKYCCIPGISMMFQYQYESRTATSSSKNNSVVYDSVIVQL